jgi:predicted nucleic acid-binding protein
MIYWDSSAALATFISEPRSLEIHRFLEQNEEIAAYTSIITPLEIESAIQRRLREKSLTDQEADTAQLYALDFRRSIFLVVTDQNSLDMALHLQKIYFLRPGDALQLAAARLGTDNPGKIFFLSLDTRLNEAARREGFQIAF